MKRIGLGTSVRALTAAFFARSLLAERPLGITSGLSMDHARAVREIERRCKQPCARKRVVCRARIAAAQAKETETARWMHERWRAGGNSDPELPEFWCGMLGWNL